MTWFRLVNFLDRNTENTQWGYHNVGRVLIWDDAKSETNVCISTPDNGWAFIGRDRNTHLFDLRELLISRKRYGTKITDIEVKVIGHDDSGWIRLEGYRATYSPKPPESVDPTLYFKNKDYGEF